MGSLVRAAASHTHTRARARSLSHADTKQACAVFSAVSCQNLIEENVFFHGPRALFNMNDDFGGDTVIKSNLFFKSLLEVGLSTAAPFGPARHLHWPIRCGVVSE